MSAFPHLAAWRRSARDHDADRAHPVSVSTDADSSTLHVRAAHGSRPTAGRSFSLPVTAALDFAAATQAAEVAALQRLASPGGWLLTREEVRRG